MTHTIKVGAYPAIRLGQHPYSKEWGVSVSDLTKAISPVSAQLGVRSRRAEQFKLFFTRLEKRTRIQCVPIEELNGFLDSMWHYKKQEAWKFFRQNLHSTITQEIETYTQSLPDLSLQQSNQATTVEPLPPFEVFKSLLDSTEQFPVDFDDAWQWIGYSRKNNALRVLEDSFISERDFCSELSKTTFPEAGRPAEQIKLTIDCFKAFCLMANTEQGKKVRRYFIDIEAQYHKERPRQETGIVITNDPDADLQRVLALTTAMIATRKEMRLLQAQNQEHAAQLLTHAQQLHDIHDDVVEQDLRLRVVEGETQQVKAITANWEELRSKAESNLTSLPSPVTPVNPRTTRSLLNEYIRGYALLNGGDQVVFRGCYEKLYREFRYRYGIDLVARARHANMKTLDYAETLPGVMDILYSLAHELFPHTVQQAS